MADFACNVVGRVRFDHRCARCGGGGGFDDRRQRRVVDLHPLGRVARPDEVGGQATATLGGSGGSQLQGAELRNAQKELASITRKLEKADTRRRQALDAMAEHDPNDYDGLGKLNEGVRAIEADVEALESRWMELSELLEG